MRTLTIVSRREDERDFDPVSSQKTGLFKSAFFKEIRAALPACHQESAPSINAICLSGAERSEEWPRSKHLFCHTKGGSTSRAQKTRHSCHWIATISSSVSEHEVSVRSYGPECGYLSHQSPQIHTSKFDTTSVQLGGNTSLSHSSTQMGRKHLQNI